MAILVFLKQILRNFLLKNNWYLKYHFIKFEHKEKKIS